MKTCGTVPGTQPALCKHQLLLLSGQKDLERSASLGSRACGGGVSGCPRWDPYSVPFRLAACWPSDFFLGCCEGDRR